MSFDARHPQGLKKSPDRSPYPAALVAAKVAPAVLARIGESYAAALTALHESLTTIGALAPEQRSVLDAGLAEIARLEAFGLQIQAFARVLAGNASLPPERVDLARAAHDAVGEWAAAARLRGASLRVRLDPVELETNAAALSQLFDLGLEHALQIGSEVEIGAAMEGFASHPVLTIRVQRLATPAAANDEELDEIHWLLFAELARAVGLAPQRLCDARTVTLVIGFRNADANAARVETASAALPHTAGAAGRRVLLIEPQDIARVHASRLMHEAGMRVATASSIDQARAGLKDEAPDVVVTGFRIDDARFHALLDEARAAQPRLRVVELVDDESAFDFSVPGSDSPARVGRRDMAQTLVRAVSQELDAAWPA